MNYNSRKINIELGINTHQTLGNCIKELIDSSYTIYNDILTKNISTTIICGGQSPSYYCLSMMNLPIYNPDLVNIVILPHSKGGVLSSDKYSENELYSQRLKENNIKIRKTAIIIDGVHSGTGILALESALKHCFENITIYKYAINSSKYISKIKVDKEYIIVSEPLFSDTFPRLINSYYPKDFEDNSKFITKFNIFKNPIAECIIDISKQYPKVQVENTQWFILNNEITPTILKEKERVLAINNKLKIQKNGSGKKFTPIVIYRPKRYQCPLCKVITGTLAVEKPYNVNLFSHNVYCPNKFKIPIEQSLNNPNKAKIII
jgi:hypothetical protein